MNETIEVTVSATGETKLETKCFTGSQCRAASAALESALGVRASERLTAEFYQQAADLHLVFLETHATRE